MSSTRHQGRLAASGLTPLLDTLFLLLLALLALSETREETPREEETEEVRVTLPSVERAEAPGVGPEDRITIVVDADSRVTLDGIVVTTPRELDQALARVIDGALPEEIAVDLAADGLARHAVTVELLQELRLRGFVDVSLLADGDASPDRPFGALAANGDGGGGE